MSLLLSNTRLKRIHNLKYTVTCGFDSFFLCYTLQFVFLSYELFLIIIIFYSGTMLFGTRHNKISLSKKSSRIHRKLHHPRRSKNMKKKQTSIGINSTEFIKTGTNSVILKNINFHSNFQNYPKKPHISIKNLFLQILQRQTLALY